MSSAKRECPACGGAGGGPFGRANSGWDIETYECPRCEGWGYLLDVESAPDESGIASTRPGLAKASPEPSVREEKERRASRG